MTFVKLHGEILDSSVWSEPHATRIVWITMLAMADQDGVVRASIGGLAHRARVTNEECRAALACFLGPDPDSRDRTTGERIEEVPGGWLILNHGNFREKQTREQALTAARVAKHRARRAAETREELEVDGNAGSNGVTRGNAASPSEADADAEADQRQKGERAEARDRVPTTSGSRRQAERPDDVAPDLWSAFLANRAAKKKPLTPKAWQLITNRFKEAGVTATEALTAAVEHGWADWNPAWSNGSTRAGSSRCGSTSIVPKQIPKDYYAGGPAVDQL